MKILITHREKLNNLLTLQKIGIQSNKIELERKNIQLNSVYIKKKIFENFSTKVIIEIVCDHLKEELISGTKKTKYLRVRQISCYMLFTHFYDISKKDFKKNYNLEDVGKDSLCGDHSNVISTVRAVQNKIDTEPKYRKIIEEISDKIIKKKKSCGKH